MKAKTLFKHVDKTQLYYILKGVLVGCSLAVSLAFFAWRLRNLVN
ncbi:hypothetical protein K4F_01770 [Enterococcus hirae]|nr:hypothetical protein K4F_01770 [Enterococcus hirae]